MNKNIIVNISFVPFLTEISTTRYLATTINCDPISLKYLEKQFF